MHVRAATVRERFHEGACSCQRPRAYFISFHTFGTWLHGNDRGSVDPLHNSFGTPHLEPDSARHQAESDQMHRSGRSAIILDNARRAVVERTICEVCAHRRWRLHMLHVRTNHVHVVLTGAGLPEPIMNSLKSWCTRRMAEARVLPPKTAAWTRHGSTRYLWDAASLDGAVKYVRDMQGKDLHGKD